MKSKQPIQLDPFDDSIPKCKCDAPGLSDHTCPFKMEIHDDDKSLCNCCANCRYECGLDI
jgi:hypothetical protein